MKNESTHPPQPAHKSRGGAGRLLKALRYSMQGLRTALRKEAAFRQELLLTIILAPIAFLLPLSAMERLALVCPLFLLLIVELLNSAIEAAIDRISLEDHPLSGHAKDLASAAVFLCLVLVATAWGLVAGPVLLGMLLQRG